MLEKCPVAMVVDGEDFHIFAPLIEITRPVENGFDGLSALFGIHSVEVPSRNQEGQRW